MHLVAVTGAPGSGKTTLARPLAAALGWSLVEKDAIKEGLAEHEPRLDREVQRRLSAQAFAAIEALLPGLREVVLEGNVYPSSPLAERLRSTTGAVEVHCCCPLERCRDRFVERDRDGRHPAHSGGTPSLDYLRQFDGPLGLPVVLEVDTTRPVDVAALVARVRAEGVGPR